MVSVVETALISGACAFLVAWFCGTILTALMCRLSWRYGALDRPDGFLKCHNKPTATLGGIPVFLAGLAGVLVLPVFVHYFPNTASVLTKEHASPGALIVAAFIMLGVGISDDLRHIIPRRKMLFQMLAAMVLVGSGLVVRRCGFFDLFEIPLGALAVPFTLFWLVGGCNAFNFIDGMDGFASGIGMVICLALAVLGFINGAFAGAIIALALGGAMLAILSFNIQPAKIFLGDSGSQLVGMLLAYLAIEVTTVNGVFMLPSAGLILAVPVVDAFLSVLRRYLGSTSPAAGDHQHIHHCLRRHGLSVNQVAMTMWLVTAITGAMAIICQLATGVHVALAALAFLIMIVYCGVRMGCLDVRALRSEFRKGYQSQTTSTQSMAAPELSVELDTVWRQLTGIFERMHLDRAVLKLQAVGNNGEQKCHTYRWARSQELLADLLEDRRTRRFALNTEHGHVATLELEAAQQRWDDNQRIDQLLKKISENMRIAQNGLRNQHDKNELVEIVQKPL